MPLQSGGQEHWAWVIADRVGLREFPLPSRDAERFRRLIPLDSSAASPPSQWRTERRVGYSHDRWQVARPSSGPSPGSPVGTTAAAFGDATTSLRYRRSSPSWLPVRDQS